MRGCAIVIWAAVGAAVGVLPDGVGLSRAHAAQATVPAEAPAAPETAATTRGRGRIVAAGRIVVAGVKGRVQVRLAEDDEWQQPTVGMELPSGCECRTGARSALELTIDPDQTLTIDRLSFVKILRAGAEGEKVTTDVGMPYGRVRYDIEAEGREYDSTIRSPSSTLAIRGTDVTLYDQPPFVPEAFSRHGRAEFRNARRQLVAFGGTTPTRVTAASEDATDAALDASVVDPSIAAARTAGEERLIRNLISRGAEFSFDAVAGIDVVRGGGPFSVNDVLPDPPGALNFVLTWPGDTDVNLGLSTTSRFDLPDFVYPVDGLSQTRNLGRTIFDHRGGPGGGIEVIHLPPDFPGHEAGPNPAPNDPRAVQYNFFAFYISGERTPVQLDVILDREVILTQNASVGPDGVTPFTLGPIPDRTARSARSVRAASPPPAVMKVKAETTRRPRAPLPAPARAVAKRR